MDGFKEILMWLALLLILALIGLSIYGAFIGAEHAAELFNSVPLQMFWFLLTVTFIAATILFPSLIKRPSLLLIHLGCIGILVGSICASETGHRMQQQLFGKYKMRSGRMLIYEGHKINKVMMSDYEGVFELPFELGLDDFRIEYYDSPGNSGPLMPKDFFSDLSVIKDGKVVLKKTIEVNHPLHYGGYCFYQYSYDDVAGKYTVLNVVSDNGLFILFGGFILLAAGLFGRCWLAPVNRALRKK